MVQTSDKGKHAPRRNGNLPKWLVKKFGESSVRKMCGLGDIIRRRQKCNQ